MHLHVTTALHAFDCAHAPLHDNPPFVHRAKVDQYAPMAFGMVLAYLQPEQVRLQMCSASVPCFIRFASLLYQACFPVLSSCTLLKRAYSRNE